MFALKKALHALAIQVSRILTRLLLPDRIPVTFLGTGASAELCESIAQMQARKVLIVTDAMLVKIGLIEKITESLRACGLEWAVFDGVEPDPTFDQVDAGFALLESSGCDSVLAVGGGSPWTRPR